MYVIIITLLLMMMNHLSLVYPLYDSHQPLLPPIIALELSLSSLHHLPSNSLSLSILTTVGSRVYVPLGFSVELLLFLLLVILEGISKILTLADSHWIVGKREEGEG